ncbi:MAG: ribosomal protein [Dehalococcoidia bacterium]|nr:ribosomal protein [Dehalococcoidia bacterium]
MTNERGSRKVRIGVVLSDAMDKTRVIGVEWSMPHWLYRRRVRRLTRFKAHDEQNATHIGDRVMITETRPLSKDKRWRIVQVMEKAEVVEIKPEEVGMAQLKELTSKEKVSEAGASLEGEEQGR